MPVSSRPEHGAGPVQARAVESSQYSVDARGGMGVQVGEGNTQIIYTYNRLTWTDGVAPPPLISVSGVVDSPYRGLSAFEEQDAAFFFGREVATTQVLERMSRLLDDAGLLVVSGVSGAGKSSLLQAGVLPRIRGAGLASSPEPASWPCLVFTPTREPLDELALRVAMLAGADAATVRRGLDTDPEGFALTVRQAALAREPEVAGNPEVPVSGRHQPAPQRRLLLVVDQFEQVFTQCSDDRQRRAFITALHAAASAGHGPGSAPAALVVLGVRADFEARCADHPQLADSVQDRYLVTAMTERQLRMAITEPARKAGSRVDDDLVEVLLAEVRIRQPGAVGGGVLPLLSHALDQAWRSRLAEALTLADYERTGGIEGAVADSAQRAYDHLTPAQQAAARQVFVRLTATGAEGMDTADRAVRAELAEGKSAAEVQNIEAVLEVFAAERLLTLAADSVEISHEVLLAAWPLLRDTWLTETHADRIVRTRLRNIAAEWTRSSGDRSYLYSGSLLQAAADTAARIGADPARHPPLSQAERSFLHASENAAARSSRRRRMLAGVLVLLLIASVAGAGFAAAAARKAGRQQRIATARLLIAEAEAARGSDPRLALLLGIAADGVHPGPEAKSGLIGTLTATRYAGTLAGYSKSVTSVAFSPERRILATLSMLSIRKPTSGNSSTAIGGCSSSNTSCSAADTSVTVSGDAIILWDLSDPARPRRLGTPLLLENVTAAGLIAFSPDGRFLATGGGNGRAVTLWDLSDPAKPVRRGSSAVPAPAADVSTDVESAAFSPDGRTLATGSDDKNVTLWNVSDPDRVTRLAAPLTGQTSSVRSVAFSPDGQELATGSDDSVRLWDISDPARPTRLGSPLAGRSPVAFSPAGHLLATHNKSEHNNNSFILWNVADPARPARVGPPLSGNNSAVAFSPDGHTAATAGFDGTTTLWDLADPARPARSGSPLAGHTDFVLSVAFSPDGRTLATGSADKTAILWNLTDPTRFTMREPPLTGVDSMAFLSKGRILASGSTDKTVSLWEISGAADPVKSGPSLTGIGTLLSPDGRTLAVLGTDGIVTLWDVSDPAHPVRHGPPLPGSGSPALFSPDGRILITGDKDKSMLWDLSDPARPVRRGPDLPAIIVLVAAFSPDGKTLATTNIYDFDGKVTLWNVSHPAQPAARRVPVLAGDASDVTSASLSPRRHILATGRSDGTTILWDISDQARPARIGQPLIGPADPNGNGGSALESTTAVLVTAFSGDGRTMATTYQDNTIILWDLTDPATPRELGPPHALTSTLVFTTRFSPKGNTLATISIDNTMTLWNLTGIKDLQGHAVERACAITGRGLNKAEWARYVPGLPYQETCAAAA